MWFAQFSKLGDPLHHSCQGLILIVQLSEAFNRVPWKFATAPAIYRVCKRVALWTQQAPHLIQLTHQKSAVVASSAAYFWLKAFSRKRSIISPRKYFPNCSSLDPVKNIVKTHVNNTAKYKVNWICYYPNGCIEQSISWLRFWYVTENGCN